MPSIQPNKHHNSANLLTKKSSPPNNLKEVPSSPLATHQYNARPVFDIPRVPATRTRGNSIQENDNRLIELKTPQPVPPKLVRVVCGASLRRGVCLTVSILPPMSSWRMTQWSLPTGDGYRRASGVLLEPLKLLPSRKARENKPVSYSYI